MQGEQRVDLDDARLRRLRRNDRRETPSPSSDRSRPTRRCRHWRGCRGRRRSRHRGRRAADRRGRRSSRRCPRRAACPKTSSARSRGGKCRSTRPSGSAGSTANRTCPRCCFRLPRSPPRLARARPPGRRAARQRGRCTRWRKMRRRFRPLFIVSLRLLPAARRAAAAEAAAAAGKSTATGEPAARAAAAPAAARRCPSAAAMRRAAAHAHGEHHEEHDDSADDAEQDRAERRATRRRRSRRRRPPIRRAGRTSRAACAPATGTTKKRTNRICVEAESAEARPSRLSSSPAARLSPPTTAMMRSTPRVDARGETALAECRRHVLADDAVRGDIGQYALESVADLDPHLPVVLRDQEQRAVVLSLAADLPLFGHAQRVRLDRLRLRRRHQQHHELVRRARLPVGQLGFERRRFGRGQRLREIRDARGQRRDRAAGRPCPLPMPAPKVRSPPTRAQRRAEAPSRAPSRACSCYGHDRDGWRGAPIEATGQLPFF